MKIKIPPYPNFKVPEEVVNRDVDPNSIHKDEYDFSPDTTKLVLLAKFDGGHRMVRARPIHVEDRVYLSAFPNPVHLYFSLAVEHFVNSENIKKVNFSSCGKPFGSNFYVLDTDENGTHECYNHFIKYRASSMIMLVTALEAFMNHIIDNSFIYLRPKAKGDGMEQLNKAAIESTKVTFKEKLTKVIPLFLQNASFWDNKQDDLRLILSLYEHRRALIHLKTNSEADLDRYFEAMDSMLGFDIEASINASIKVMNDCSPDFITF